MVLWDSPVAWTTAVLPPQPIPIASAAAHCLRILSFMRGLRSLNLRRRLSTITESGILTEEHLGSYCQVIIAQFLIVQVVIVFVLLPQSLMHRAMLLFELAVESAVFPPRHG